MLWRILLLFFVFVCFFKQANSLQGLRLQVLTSHFRIVVLTLVLFSKPLPYSSDIFWVYTFQRLVWVLGSGLSFFFRVFDTMFRIWSKQLLFRGEPRRLHTTFWSHVPEFLYLHGVIWIPGLPFFPPLKADVLHFLFCCIAPTATLMSKAKWCVLMCLSHSLRFLFCSEQKDIIDVWK